MVSGTERLRRLAHDPRAEPLQQLLRRREVLDGPDLAVADHHVGVAGQDRRHQALDVRPVVLVVGVGVDDHVGAELERRVEPGLEARGEPLVVGQAHDVVDAVRARHLDGAVGRAVVDDQPFDALEARHLARKVGQRDRERLLLVQARDLDDQLHRRAKRRYRLVILYRSMEGLTLTRRPALARGRSLDAELIARVAFGLLCLAFAIGFFVYPTYPNYDSYYSLLWGQEVLDLTKPGFEGFRVPTEHPLAIALGALLSLFGESGDRLFIAVILASFLWLIWGVYRLGQVAFTPLVGGIAAVLVLTRFDFGFLAARGYIDIPYMALVMWAAVLEARTPRRGAPVLVLLALAGMLRPEAWVLAGLYWLWVAWRASWRQRALYAALAAIGPLVWTATDFVVTGDPLFSLLYTSGSAEDLGRQRTLAELPTAIPGFLNLIVKLPILLAAAGGLLLARGAGAAARRRCRSRCSSPASGRSC